MSIVTTARPQLLTAVRALACGNSCLRRATRMGLPAIAMSTTWAATGAAAAAAQ